MQRACFALPTPRPIAARVLFALLVLLNADALRGAMVMGPWVEQAERDIFQHRQRDVRIIVLDARGRVVEGAEIRVEQLTRPFLLGARVEAKDVTQQERALARARHAGLPIHAVLGEDGPAPPDAPDAPDAQDAPDAEDAPATPSDPNTSDASDTKRKAPPLVDLAGPLVSSDLARWPDAWARLDGAALRDRLLERIDRGTAGADRVIPLGDLLRSRHAVEERLGEGFARLAIQRVGGRFPRAKRGVFAANALLGSKQDEMIRRVIELREAFVPFEFVAVSYRDTTPLPPLRMAGELRRLRTLESPILVLDLQTGGENPIEAAQHVEALLRLLYAMPEVEGVFFPGLDSKAFAEPHASLLDDNGELTSVGRVVARLFGETWRSNHTLQTDAAGNAYARLFHGTHRFTVSLPSGDTFKSEVRIPAGAGNRIVVLQALQ